MKGLDRDTLIVTITSGVLTLALTLFPASAQDEQLTSRVVDASRGVPDAGGRVGSLFVHEGGEHWRQPLAVYPSAVLIRAGVPQQLALRAPAALAGALTIVLTYLLALRVSDRRGLAVFAAALLVVMPGFHRHVRSVGADVAMVPLVLIWLLAVLEHLREPRRWLLLVGGAALGVSAYTQPAGVLAVPIYFVIGAFLLVRAGRPVRSLIVGATGLMVTLLPVVAWLARWPEAYPDTFGRWAIHAAHVRNPWDGLVAFTRWHVMARRVSDYWDYLNPTFLFGRDMLGLVMLVLVPLGLWTATRSGLTASGARWLIVAGFFAAPAPAVLLDVPRSPALALLYAPFGATLAALTWLARSPRSGV